MRRTNDRMRRELKSKSDEILSREEYQKQAEVETNQKMYTVYIQFAGRTMKIGTYDTQEAAEEAEKRAKRELK